MGTRKAVMINGRRASVARLKAEKALKRPLKGEELVHHLNGDPSNDSNINLVICPDRDCHSLLHIRLDALQNSGNADLRRCQFCCDYDRSENLVLRKEAGKKDTSIYHASCLNAYARYRRVSRGA